MSKLIEITTDLGTTYLVTAQVDVEYNGNTYQAGFVDKVSRVSQEAEVSSGKLSLQLSGVDQSMISLFENEDWRNRLCTVYECDIAKDWSVSNVVEYYEGDMIDVRYTLGKNKSIVRLDCKTLYGSINRANAPDLGVLFDQYITDDVTHYFGKTGPINSRRSGKPGFPPPDIHDYNPGGP